MHNAPIVYVPTQPKGNGIALPTLLSLLVHGLVVGALVYSFHATTVETASSIETVMISPEQLADMQGQILANRTAAAQSTQTSNTTVETSASVPSQTSSDSTDSQPNTQSVPVFTRSDDSPSQPILMSEEQQQQLSERRETYRRQVAESAVQIDQKTLEEQEAVAEDRRRQQREEQERLNEFRQKQNNPPKIERSTASDPNIRIDSGGAESTEQVFSLSDGQPTRSGSTQDSSQAAASGSRGTSNSEILRLIKNNYSPAQGSTQRTTLTITVDTNGSITNVSASGPDSAVNQAARQAVLDTGSLPISPDDPKYPTFTIKFRGRN
ncbi:cell envelope integrity protein TolA [Psychrobacter sp.]|uniref:cell envelope integrity protein TolA n=1 Tax=Psychrobacter sp. TaxID=56811 RepID=UPI002649C665|nr:cell envelope integrity protein TolA [Psychrobacter sp.]MDN6308825.1 cell envelope integrity protein TolA [Psychrobacter sp.]